MQPKIKCVCKVKTWGLWRASEGSNPGQENGSESHWCCSVLLNIDKWSIWACQEREVCLGQKAEPCPQHPVCCCNKLLGCRSSCTHFFCAHGAEDEQPDWRGGSLRELLSVLLFWLLFWEKVEFGVFCSPAERAEQRVSLFFCCPVRLSRGFLRTDWAAWLKGWTCQGEFLGAMCFLGGERREGKMFPLLEVRGV